MLQKHLGVKILQILYSREFPCTVIHNSVKEIKFCVKLYLVKNCTNTALKKIFVSCYMEYFDG